MITRKLGKVFADELSKSTGRFGHFKKRKILENDWTPLLVPHYQHQSAYVTTEWQLITLFIVVLIAFFGLFLRIFHLQIVKGATNRELADSNRMQVKIIHAPRGVIYDRSGRVLADNNPGFRIKDPQDPPVGKYQVISRDKSLEYEAKNDPKFSQLEIDTIRAYPEKLVSAHILGYVSEISSDELKEPQFIGYTAGDRIGKGGIEQIFENILKGKDGAEIVEVDAQGKKLRSLRKVEPIPGNNIHLSIDIDLQRYVFGLLKGAIEKVGVCCGAALVSDPKTGEILTLVSYPSYDPNAFTDPTRGSEIMEYFEDVQTPLINRAIAGVYPPGSTFKITSALAGLISAKVSASELIEDTGIINLGPYTFTNWYFTGYGKTEGLVDMVKALQRSNDTYFYRLGEKIGEKTLGEVAKRVSFGKKVGIDLPAEAEGVIPTNEWKQEKIGEVWYPGDTLHMAIGQGFILATPLQILSQTAFIANNGQLARPHLATKVTSASGFPVKEFKYEPDSKDIFKKEDLDIIKMGLSKVTKTGGTAWPFFNFSIPSAGKTGTAEFGDPKGRTHAWYLAYAPEAEAEIAAVVLIEAGGEGSSVAAPVVKDIMRWYFSTDKNNIQSLDVYPVSTSSAGRNE